MTHSFYTTDVAIIGAGPVGLFGIFECGMHNLKCHVIDALPEIGGQCTALYPEKPIYDIPAHPSLLAQELIEKLREQAAPFDPTFHLGQEVTHVTPHENGWQLQTSKNVILHAKAIIIAAGVGAFRPNRPPLDGIENYENTHVFYAVRNKDTLRGKRVVIAGGGDSACDWALNLAESAAHIYLVHRRDKFRAAAPTLEALKDLEKQGKVEFVVPYQLSGLQGDGKALQGISVENLDGTSRLLEADALLAFFGLSMNLGPIATWGLNLDHHHIKVDQGTAQTSTPGIYAIGDIASYPHKMKLILTGFAEAAQAAQAIRSQIYLGQVFHFEYSTTQGTPKFQK